MSKEYSPQLEDGHTRIANEWFEAFVRARYPGAVKDFVWAVVRMTWGWQKVDAEISVEQFREMLGVGKSQIYRLRDDALRHNLIECDAGEHSDRPVYRVQKYYLEWIAFTTKRSGSWQKTVSHMRDSPAREEQSRTEGAETVPHVGDGDSTLYEGQPNATSATGAGPPEVVKKGLKKGKEKEEESLSEGGPSNSAPPNGQHPAADSLGFNSNDDGTAIIQTAFDMLAEFAADNEPNLRTDIENLYKAYPDHVVDAAMATASTLRDGKDRKWNAHAAAYLRATASNMAADAKESNEADPARRPFVLLFGVEPHTPVDRADWNDNLRKFRHWPQEFIRRQEIIHSIGNPQYWEGLRAKATALGFWWDGVKPYLEAARQRHNRIEVTPGVRQRYETEQMAELDEQIAKLEEELSLEQADSAASN